MYFVCYVTAAAPVGYDAMHAAGSNEVDIYERENNNVQFTITHAQTGRENDSFYGKKYTLVSHCRRYGVLLVQACCCIHTSNKLPQRNTSIHIIPTNTKTCLPHSPPPAHPIAQNNRPQKLEQKQKKHQATTLTGFTHAQAHTHIRKRRRHPPRASGACRQLSSSCYCNRMATNE